MDFEIPHAPPYRLVDGIDPQGCTARAPAHPALLIEVCAQACAALGGGRRGVLLGVKGFAIARTPLPGEALRVRVARRGGTADGEIFRAEVDDEGGARVAAGDLFVALG
jgi:hypothetical protein